MRESDQRGASKAPRATARSGRHVDPPESAVVVAVGASGGGLDALRGFFGAMAEPMDMAFLVIQHQAPRHASVLVSLLASQTRMLVHQAVDGATVEIRHVYVAPPGHDLAIDGERLVVTERPDGPSTPQPFDHLLNSLARSRGRRAVGVVLSGAGDDGRRGVTAVRSCGGLVIAQSPSEAAQPGMPSAAMETGCVDHVLAVATMAPVLADFAAFGAKGPPGDALAAIVATLRASGAPDFSAYKAGPLSRRIQRRIEALGAEVPTWSAYLDKLESEPGERALLAQELLINVTSFFRDPAVFDEMARSILPALIEDHPEGQPLRVWVAGCSTGEEAYSLAILFREAITASGRALSLKVFASDVDAAAVAAAREGVYPHAIEADVTPERLAAFFVNEAKCYRVTPELRASIVFAVQDLLVDPPFSRLDFVSCRNVLIYLEPAARTRAMTLFHFALRPAGFLLLGASETAAEADGQFHPASRVARLFRRVDTGREGRRPTREPAFVAPSNGGAAAHPPRVALGDACWLALEGAGLTAGLVMTARFECLLVIGDVEAFFDVAPASRPTDVMARLDQAALERVRCLVFRAIRSGGPSRTHFIHSCPSGHGAVEMNAIPVEVDATTFYVVGFRPAKPGHDGGADLAEELAAMRADLAHAMTELERAEERRRIVDDEALSVSEEFQTTNEELLTSKEELQLLNDELTALNARLQDGLERQRALSNDLKNVLYSTTVATLFLDVDLNIRFFTPAIRSLFRVIEGDIGRPLADLAPLAADRTLARDAAHVLRGEEPAERDIETAEGRWFTRRILPYRTLAGAIEGVVITFNDVTEAKRTARAILAARQVAEAATLAKSRFLAAASHDLRQPLQTLSLLHARLAQLLPDDPGAGLIQKVDATIGAMSAMLDTLLDVNKIEAGTVEVTIAPEPIGDLLARIRDDFSEQARDKSLSLRVKSTSLRAMTDRRLLDQIIRNLVANAIKYTATGRIVVGCRRRADRIAIEVWDTGAGIPDAELKAIFEEYHQLDNDAHIAGKGLGLGLAIVDRLARLLSHKVGVRSRVGRGSVFSVEMARAPDSPPTVEKIPPTPAADVARAPPSGGAVLVVEDEPDLRELLAHVLEEAGLHVKAVVDGRAALAVAALGQFPFSVVLADYNLPGGMTGVEVCNALRRLVSREIGAVILTGDISTRALRDIADYPCVRLNKPIKPPELVKTIGEMMRSLEAGPRRDAPETLEPSPRIVVVDDDAELGATLVATLSARGHQATWFGSAEAMLASADEMAVLCFLVDATLPGLSGLDLIRRLVADGHGAPIIMFTGNGDVPLAVRALKAGASDFIEKPIGEDALLDRIGRALRQTRAGVEAEDRRLLKAQRIRRLTPRQVQIMDLVLAGHPSKNIATDLNLSRRTVENHRAAIMRKMEAKSLPGLARAALALGD